MVADGGDNQLLGRPKLLELVTHMQSNMKHINDGMQDPSLNNRMSKFTQQKTALSGTLWSILLRNNINRFKYPSCPFATHTTATMRMDDCSGITRTIRRRPWPRPCSIRSGRRSASRRCAARGSNVCRSAGQQLLPLFTFHSRFHFG